MDLLGEQLILSDSEILKFKIAPFSKYCLLNGLGDIELTLRHAEKIAAFEASRIIKMPWLLNCTADRFN